MHTGVILRRTKEHPMYSTKVLGNSTAGTMSINHSSHKAALKEAIKNKKQLPTARRRSVRQAVGRRTATA